jgi:hypothetical protein
LKIRFVKKLYAWLLTHIGLALSLFIAFYFYFLHDGEFNLGSAVDVKFLLGVVLSHGMLFFYLVGFVQFTMKESTIDLYIESNKFSIKNEKERYFRKIIVNRRRIDDRLADIGFIDQYGNVFEISSCYVSENGIDNLITELRSLGCSVEIQKHML